MTEKSTLHVAFEKFEIRKDARTLARYRVLPAEPGRAHVLDVTGTREGNPWRKYGVRRSTLLTHREPKFYDGTGPLAACGVRVKVVVALQFDADDPDACLDCAQAVRDGKAFRSVPTYNELSCTAVVTLQDEDSHPTYWCVLRVDHSGPHRASSGETWQEGEGDFTPAPDGYV